MPHDGRLVRRERYDNAAFVHRVLKFLELRNFDGAPRFVGVDGDGRETVSFLPGDLVDSELLLSDTHVAGS